MRIEEFNHAYLVHGTNLVEDAKRALWKHLGKKRWSRIARMPARPLWTGEMGDKPGHSAVALYFNIGPACECHEQEDKYKP